MKRIGFITKNKVFAQSLAPQIRNNPDLGYEPFLLLNLGQAALDAEVLKIDFAVIDTIAETAKEIEMVLDLCKELRKAAVGCRILLLVSQDSREGCDLAMKSLKDKIIDDFVFYDESLEYLLAKLSSLK